MGIKLRRGASRALLALALVACAPGLLANSGGITGQSGRPGSGTCNSCHGITGGFVYEPAVPATTVETGSSTVFTLTFTKTTGADAGAAGFNLSATAGTLQDPDTGACTVRAASGEVTHASRCLGAGPHSWNFRWVAPSTPGTVTFHYCARAVDNAGNGSGGDAQGVCTTTDIMVVEANRPPVVASPIANQGATEDSAFSFQFDAGTFSDPDADTLSYSATRPDGSALPAWLSFSAGTRTFSGTPANADVGAFTVRVTARDPDLAGASDDFDITVVNVNDAPVAVDDNLGVDPDTRDNTLPVLANDSDVDAGDTLSIQSVGAPDQGGTVTVNPGGGSLNYSPAAGFSGTETFVYTVKDVASATDMATVTITVPVTPNRAPVAVNDSYNASEDSVLTVPAATGVLANDSDADANTLTATLLNAPQNGQVSLSADGGFSYTPDQNYNGSDSFSYQANDSFVNSGPATVTIGVAPANDAPVAVNDNYTTAQGQTLTVSGAGVLANDSDVDSGTILSAVLVSPPASGMLAFSAAGTFSYTPNAGFSGGDSFAYRAHDGATDSNIATVTLTVTAVPANAGGGGGGGGALAGVCLLMLASGAAGMRWRRRGR